VALGATLGPQRFLEVEQVFGDGSAASLVQQGRIMAELQLPFEFAGLSLRDLGSAPSACP
jgi:hypothetical protein